MRIVEGPMIARVPGKAAPARGEPATGAAKMCSQRPSFSTYLNLRDSQI